jgi:methanethiol S-methyltransferase
MDAWKIGLAWLLFYAIHSLLASAQVKQKVAQKSPKIFNYYRLFYNTVAMLSFAPLVIWQLQIQSPNWFEPMPYLSGALQGAGGLILLLALRNYDLSAFAGIDAWQKSAANLELEPLKTSGLNAWVRHPLYLAIVVILIGFFIGRPQQASLIFMLITFLYLLLGIWLEEAKLLQIYGKDYQAYQQKVKCLIPFIF